MLQRILYPLSLDIPGLGPTDRHGRSPVSRIEVKGRNGYNVPVALTLNEWLQAGRHGDSAGYTLPGTTIVTVVDH